MWGVTSESFDLEHYWYAGTSSEQLGQGHLSRSQGQGHTSITKYTHAGALPLTESQSCYIHFLLNNPLNSRGVNWLHFAIHPPKPRFLITDIRALWHSALSARVPECQKLKM